MITSQTSWYVKFYIPHTQKLGDFIHNARYEISSSISVDLGKDFIEIVYGPYYSLDKATRVSNAFVHLANSNFITFKDKP